MSRQLDRSLRYLISAKTDHAPTLRIRHLPGSCGAGPTMGNHSVLTIRHSVEDAGCVFSLGDPGLDHFDVRFESDPDVGMPGTQSGQKVVVRLNPSG